MSKKKEVGHSEVSKLSNNVLVLILIVVIFVSILGTITITETIKGAGKKSAQGLMQEEKSLSGMVALSVLPPEESGNK